MTFLIYGRGNKRDEKKQENQTNEDDNKMKDKDYRRQAGFEQDNDEEISGEDSMFSIVSQTAVE
jgi:hypothetical protein